MIVDEKRPGVQIRFYSKPGCCLCDEAWAVLEELGRELPLEILRVDISRSPELLRRYGEEIPVAEWEGRKLFKYRADKATLRRMLQRAVKA